MFVFPSFIARNSVRENTFSAPETTKMKQLFTIKVIYKYREILFFSFFQSDWIISLCKTRWSVELQISKMLSIARIRITFDWTWLLVQQKMSLLSMINLVFDKHKNKHSNRVPLFLSLKCVCVCFLIDKWTN